MWLEGQHRERSVETARQRFRFAEHGLMAKMHAVEIAGRDHGAARVIARVGVTENAHQLFDGTRTVASPSITTVAPTPHCVFNTTRFLSATISATVITVSTLSPGRTGALNERDCAR